MKLKILFITGIVFAPELAIASMGPHAKQPVPVVTQNLINLIDQAGKALSEAHTEKDYAIAFMLYTKAYQASINQNNIIGYATTAYHLGVIYDKCFGRMQNNEEDLKTFREKALKYFNEAFVILKLSIYDPNLRNNLSLRNVYAHSANYLGRYHKDGYGVIKDNTKALIFFLEAYKASTDLSDSYPHADAAANIGRIYLIFNDPVHAGKYLDEAYRLGKKNNYKNIIISAAVNLGVLSKEQNNYEKKALGYLFEAYKESSPNSPEHASAANNIGGIYISLGKHTEAKKWFDEAYKLSKQYNYEDIFYSAANNLGVLYTNDIEPNDDLAIKYYEEAYKSKDLKTHALAARNLGARYLYSRTRRDFSKARKYLEEATISVNVPDDTHELAIHDLYAMQQILLAKFDNLIAEIEDNLLSRSAIDLRPLLKQARKTLEEAKQINISFGVDKDRELSNIMAAKQEKFNKVREAMREQRKKEIAAQIQAPEAESLQEHIVEVGLLDQAEKTLNNNDLDTAKRLLTDFRKMDSKNINSRKKFRELERTYAQQKVSSILNAFEKQFKDYSVQPDQTIFARTIHLLEEATELASFLSATTNDMSTSNRIRQDYEQLYKRRKEIHETKEALASMGKIEAQAAHQEIPIILDPFSQLSLIPHEFIESIKSHLETLVTEYPNIHGAEKIKSLKNTWRIRAGNYRILYTMLPNHHAIGIVVIDSRKDVYNAPAQAKNHENWIYKYNTYTPDRIYTDIQVEQKKDNPAKEIALIKLYLHITSEQSNSVQRKELSSRLEKLEHGSTVGFPKPPSPEDRNLISEVDAALANNDLPLARNLLQRITVEQPHNTTLINIIDKHIKNKEAERKTPGFAYPGLPSRQAMTGEVLT